MTLFIYEPALFLCSAGSIAGIDGEVSLLADLIMNVNITSSITAVVVVVIVTMMRMMIIKISTLG
jgi:hypothetical protein